MPYQTSLELMARTRWVRRPSVDAARRYSLVQEQGTFTTTTVHRRYILLTDGSAPKNSADEDGVESSSHKRTRSDTATTIKPPAATSGRGLHKRSRPAKKDVKDTGNTNDSHAANGSVPTHQGAGEGLVPTRQDTGNTDDSHAANGSVPTHQGAGEGPASTHQGAAGTNNGPAFYGHTSNWGTNLSFDPPQSGLLDPSQYGMLDPSQSSILDPSQSSMLGPSQYGMQSRMLDPSQSSVLRPSQYGMRDTLQSGMFGLSPSGMLHSSGHNSLGSSQTGLSRGSLTSQGNTSLCAQAPAFNSTSPSLLRDENWHPETHLASLSEMTALFDNGLSIGQQQ